MLYHAVLPYTVQYYYIVTLFYAMLGYIVLGYATLHYYTVLFYDVLRYATLMLLTTKASIERSSESSAPLLTPSSAVWPSVGAGPGAQLLCGLCGQRHHLHRHQPRRAPLHPRSQPQHLQTAAGPQHHAGKHCTAPVSSDQDTLVMLVFLSA